MVMHPQEIIDNKLIEKENNLWWELDKIVVEFSYNTPTDTLTERLKKAEAASTMMSFLHRPSRAWCKEKYKSERKLR